jgi:hypothetical protein
MGAEKRKRHVSKQHKNSSLFVQERYTLADGIPLSYTLPFFHSMGENATSDFSFVFSVFFGKTHAQEAPIIVGVITLVHRIPSLHGRESCGSSKYGRREYSPCFFRDLAGRLLSTHSFFIWVICADYNFFDVAYDRISLYV